jgi:UDP-2,3-diacylglucosamine hydrolase
VLPVSSSDPTSSAVDVSNRDVRPAGRAAPTYNARMPTLFISDLHLDAERPQVTARFLRFLREDARGADALYILGDLFEAWVGDDDPSQTGAVVADGVRALVDASVPVHFMRGNRDFLLGRGYAARAGITLLPDPAVVLVDGRPVLLMHGDTLCTGDTAYQAFRAQTRDPRWQAQFLAQPLAARLAFAAQARTASRAHQAGLQDRMESITDVAPAAVHDAFVRYGIDTLVHGHTHRPAVHALDVDGRACRRIVLGDWYEQGSVLRMDASGATLQTLDIAAG